MLEIQNILLLEDSEADQIMIKRYLFSAGILANIIACDNKESFNKNLKNLKPDLVLLDYHVPGFNYNEAFSILKKINPNIPVIYVTGVIPINIASQTSLVDADAFVIKDNLSDLPLVVQSVYLHKIAKNGKDKSTSLDDLDKRKKLLELMKSNKIFMGFLNN
ncbi:response regulator [Chondrinema litorale]|uniref:response regulator n=1 Tax=Chondrinema litorale TaxID=2994555 RepID=UPI002543752C|nr:response regulator [Chondrinema litorale]UZR97225.1 response regulator [Chondrinema litorale]